MASDFSGVAKLSKMMDQFGRALGGDGAKIIAQAMGAEAQKIARAAASVDLGGDPKFSG